MTYYSANSNSTVSLNNRAQKRPNNHKMKFDRDDNSLTSSRNDTRSNSSSSLFFNDSQLNTRSNSVNNNLNGNNNSNNKARFKPYSRGGNQDSFSSYRKRSMCLAFINFKITTRTKKFFSLEKKRFFFKLFLKILKNQNVFYWAKNERKTFIIEFFYFI